MDADVIVIGAGPAGGMAAYQLAPRASVLLLERSRLPRDKTCSRVLTAKAAQMLAGAVDLEPAVCGSFAETRIGKGQVQNVHRHTPLRIADRASLDFSLLSAAARRGASVAEGVRVQAVYPEEGQVELASGKRLSAQVVIGADGAMGVASRAINGRLPGHALAMEARLRDPRPVGQRAARIGFDLPQGYCWAFPHDGGGLAVGGGSADPKVFGQMRGRIRRWVAVHFGVDVPPAALRAHFVPCRGVARCVAGRTLLVGDAAGLVDPLLGEGIAYALWSGILAARVCAEHLRGQGALSRYDHLVRAKILRFQRPLRAVSRLPGSGTVVTYALQAAPLRALGWRNMIERRPTGLAADLRPTSSGAGYPRQG